MPISSSKIQTLTNSVKDTYVYPRTLSSAVIAESGNLYGGSTNETLDTTLSRVVFLNITQTITGAKTFSLDTNFESSIKLLGTSANAAKIQYSRAGYNYVQIPTSGTFAVNFGDTLGQTYSSLIATSTQVFPGVTNTISLGTSSYKWSKLYVGSAAGYGSSTQPIYWNDGLPVAGSIYAGGTAVTLNGTDKSGLDASFYAPTSAGTSGYYLQSNGSGAPTWTSFPTIPTITLNGSSTTSPSFYAPTTAGTSGYILTSAGSGAPSWTQTLSVEHGGTGATSFTSGYALIGGGTGAITTKAISSSPSSGSTNLITSGAVYSAVNRADAITAANTSYTTAMARAIYATTNDIGVNGSLTNGTICLVYET